MSDLQIRMTLTKGCVVRRSHRLKTKGWPSRHSHIFDGIHLTTETAAFQLCDIEDSMLKDMIEDEEDFRDTCNVGSFRVVTLVNLNIYRSLRTGGSHRMRSSASRSFFDISSSLYWMGMSRQTRNAKHCL
jgi:hypothetical protein